MTLARLCAAVAAVALAMVLLLPGSANAGWHGRTHPHWIRIYPALDRIYPPQRWGHPGVDLGWSYPMYGEYVRGPHYFHRVYYYQMPPYYDCCW